MYQRTQQIALSLGIALLCLITLVGCAGRMSGGASETAHHEAHWGYEGEGGPEHWGNLDPAYAVCSLGLAQSPIDIDTASVVSQELPDLQFHYQPSPLQMVNNGHTIQANLEPGSSIEIDGTEYELLQFHFHALSEHTIDGRAFPMEAHFVHKSTDGTLAVIGVMIEEGAENEAYARVWMHLPVHAGGEHSLSDPVAAETLLPSDRRTYRYSGSLTTPPCSEGVRWNLMTLPIELSSAQIAAFTQLYAANARPVQPLNDREVLLDASVDQQ